MQVCSLGGEYPLEEDMATHSSILAWRIPWTEEPGGLWSIGLQSHDWSVLAAVAATDITQSETTVEFIAFADISAH